MAATPDEARTARIRARPDPRGSTLVLLLSGSIAPADIPRICAAAHRLMAATEDGTVVCDVEALVSPDAAAVDALARLQLAARRLHREIRLERASEELAALIELSGLSDVIPNGAGSGLEPRSQAE